MFIQPDINVKECCDFTKIILNNAGNIWEKSDLNTRQRLQGLITPIGIYFEKNLIKPLKNPYLLSLFQNKTLKNNVWGGLIFELYNQLATELYY
jgi:hypothetical protein